jgi:hypothetical protein
MISIAALCLVHSKYFVRPKVAGCRLVKNQQKNYRRSPFKKADKISLFMLFGKSPAISSETHSDFLGSSSRTFGRTLTVVVLPVFRQSPAIIYSLCIYPKKIENFCSGNFTISKFEA